MALVNYSFTALLESDAAGQNTAANQAVSVKRESDNGLATIYSDAAGTTPISQPGAVTDSNGVLSFWVLPGYYVIESGTRSELALISAFLNGDSAQPSITFKDDIDTGFFRKQANSIGFSTGGIERMVMTSAGRIGINKETPTAKLHVVVNNDVTAGIRSTCSWTGSTGSPYQNNDNTLFETHNEILSDSTNYSWSVSADNGSNNIPAGVTDLGFRKGVYGWAVSKDTASAKHNGTLALQIGVHGLAGFLGAGNTAIGTVTESIAVRGEINHDAVSATIDTATAVEAISASTLGTVNVNYGVRSIALNGVTENWSFHGDGGQFFNEDKVFSGSKFTELDSAFCGRGVGNVFEFGFPSSGGYQSAVGVMPSSGNPFISLACNVDAVTDTFSTTGQLGFVIENNLGADSLIFSRLTNTNGTGLTPSESFRVDQNGRVQFQDTVILSAFAPASATATGQTGQISWDADYIYMCVATNTWRRVAIATW